MSSKTSEPASSSSSDSPAASGRACKFSIPSFPSRKSPRYLIECRISSCLRCQLQVSKRAMLAVRAKTGTYPSRNDLITRQQKTIASSVPQLDLVAIVGTKLVVEPVDG